jgi:hypothetical protein
MLFTATIVLWLFSRNATFGFVRGVLTDSYGRTDWLDVADSRFVWSISVFRTDAFSEFPKSKIIPPHWQWRNEKLIARYPVLSFRRTKLGVRCLGFTFESKMIFSMKEDTRYTTVPCWFVAAVFAIPSIVQVRRWASILRKNQGLCLRCGYDLRATPDRFPECGMVPNRMAVPHPHV